jgi:ubiquinone/menaquinone biosynthesis C-methylase UbiE
MSPGTDDQSTYDPVASAQSFYTRWAGVYDVIARRAPGADSLRQRAVEALDLTPGDVVLDLGCGTGANFPHLRAAVGAEGRVVGVDFAPGPVAIARERASAWPNVHVLRGDAAKLPVGVHADGPPMNEWAPDAVLASFVVGMLSDPGAAVRSWADHVGAGGRLALVDLARTSQPPWRLLNPVFGVVTRASAPPGSNARRETDAVDVLDRRVATAHEALADCCRDVHRSTHVGGYARISAGRVEDARQTEPQ